MEDKLGSAEQKKWTAEQQFREREIALKEREQTFQQSRRFEEQKWEEERALREREFSLKNRAQTVSERDFALRNEELARSRWRSPLVVAILAAAVAAMGNAVVALVNGMQGQTLEDTRAESARILEMIKTGDADKAAANLRFLADAGLISNPHRLAAVQRFLKDRSPGQGPSLPPTSGNPGLQPTRTLPQLDPLRPSTLAVGQLQLSRSGKASAICTAFRVTKDLILTASYCVVPTPTEGTVFFAPVSADGFTRANVEVILPAKETIELPAQSSGPTNRVSMGVVLLQIKNADAFSDSWLTLARKPPSVGQSLAAIAFMASPDQMIARDPDCKVLSVEPDHFSHQCSLDSGSGGAPILSADGTQVVGVELWGGRGVEWAARADQLLARSEILQRALTPASK